MYVFDWKNYMTVYTTWLLHNAERDLFATAKYLCFLHRLTLQNTALTSKCILILMFNHKIAPLTCTKYQECVATGMMTTIISCKLLSRDAMHQRGLCCRAVSVRCPSRSCVVSKRLQIRPYLNANRKLYTQVFEWYHFWWPWVTPNPHFNITPPVVNWRWISQKRYKIELY